MAMDIGSILVCGDYKGDLKEIANVLGRLINYYPDDELAFRVDEKENRLVWDGDCCLSTSVNPTRSLLMLNDGRRVYADEADELVLKQWEADGGDLDLEQCSLERVSRLISPFLKSGTIELVSFANMQCFFITYERLIIRCDGTVELHSHDSSSRMDECWTDCQSERYDPTAKRDAA